MHFEKVKFEAFERDMMSYRPMNFLGSQAHEAYDNISLPERKTKYSCGYDVKTPIRITIRPHDSMVIPTENWLSRSLRIRITSTLSGFPDIRIRHPLYRPFW